jgi:hypothetical protein
MYFLSPFSLSWRMCQQILLKLHSFKCHESTFSRSPVVTCVQADGRTERFSKVLREVSNAPNKVAHYYVSLKVCFLYTQWVF